MQYLDLNITNHLPKITTDYLNNKKNIKNLYNRPFNIKNFSKQIEEKKKNYDDDFRSIICDALTKNYKKIKNNSIQINAIKD